MSCKTAIYAANTTSQTITSGTVINFGNVVRRFGCGLNISGGNIEVRASGYYDVDVNLTITPTTAGTGVVQVYRDGVAVPGAIATFAGVADTPIVLSIPAIIRETCDCLSTITVTITDITGAINNAAIVAEKI